MVESRDVRESCRRPSPFPWPTALNDSTTWKDERMSWNGDLSIFVVPNDVDLNDKSSPSDFKTDRKAFEP